MKEIAEFYGTDFNHDLLTTQLNVLHTNSGPSLRDLKSVVPYLKTLNEVERNFFPEVISIVKSILVMPATNALSERSFSALHRLKTWLRSTMSQSRLNWCMVLNVHREKTDELQMIPLLIGHYESRIDLKSHNIVLNLYYDILGGGGVQPPKPPTPPQCLQAWAGF